MRLDKKNPIRVARISCIGEIHDHDLFSADEHDSYNWSDSVILEQGGFSREWVQSKTVDGEVTLKIKLLLLSTQAGMIYVSGKMELREGGVYETLDASTAVGLTPIEPGQVVEFLNTRLKNDGGDWVSTKLEIKNDSP
ncbi:MAG: hypothetical protein ACMUIA_12670 [bacterium]